MPLTKQERKRRRYLEVKRLIFKIIESYKKTHTTYAENMQHPIFEHKDFSIYFHKTPYSQAKYTFQLENEPPMRIVFPHIGVIGHVYESLKEKKKLQEVITSLEVAYLGIC